MSLMYEKINEVSRQQREREIGRLLAVGRARREMRALRQQARDELQLARARARRKLQLARSEARHELRTARAAARRLRTAGAPRQPTASPRPGCADTHARCERGTGSATAGSATAGSAAAGSPQR